MCVCVCVFAFHAKTAQRIETKLEVYMQLDLDLHIGGSRYQSVYPDHLDRGKTVLRINTTGVLASHTKTG